MSLPSEEPGLRERKRLATRRAIELAVLTQARERGIENVTVEDISRVAGVSPRTFFNYFPSKDAALVGDTPTLGPDSDADVEAFVHGGPEGDILAQLAVVLTASLRRAEEDLEIHRLRREVLNDNAYLFGLRMTTLRDFESRLQGIVARRFTTDHPELTTDPVALDQRALLFTLVAVAAMRHAWRCWADSGGAEPLSERLAASFAQLYNITRPTE
ncbi:MAG TPA: TetR family transcriptional regulator [Cryobacterium sp.]|nr:TetR family transcriptional regulator [Cryobacterium sp.]